MVKAGETASEPESSSYDGSRRGDYCFVYATFAAVPEHGYAATVDPVKLLPKEDQYKLSRK